MNVSMRDFLAQSVQLEASAADGYSVLAAAMSTAGNNELAELFNKLGEFSRLHLNEVSEHYRQVAGCDPSPSAAPWSWPDGSSPEDPRASPPGPETSVRQALAMAMALECAACDYYSGIANQSRDAEVQELAQMFAEEESEHVSHLERWIQRLEQD